MKIPNDNELNIQCILATETPKIPSGYSGSGQRDNTVVLYKLLISLGLLRWIVTRELKDIDELNKSLQVSRNIACFLPSTLERRHSARGVAMELITKYFSKLVKHSCSADGEFFLFATDSMTILQYFIVKGSPRVNMDGVYVFKEWQEGQGAFSRYEKQDNPKYAIINMIWEGETGWYLVDEWQVYFYAMGLDKFSEFPPEGVWRAVDPGKLWSERIEVRSGVPTKVDIEKSLRRKLRVFYRHNTSKTKSGRLSLRLGRATAVKHRRHSSLPANVENVYADMLHASVTSCNESIPKLAHARKSYPSSPVEKVHHDQRQEWGDEIFLIEKAPTSEQTKTVHPPLWLTTPLPPNLKMEQQENGLKHETNHWSLKDELKTVKTPLKFNISKIKIPKGRPLLAESEASLDSDNENSIEMLSPRKYGRNFSEGNRSNDSNRRSFLSSDESRSSKWLSYQVHTTDDSASSPSINQSWSCELLGASADIPVNGSSIGTCDSHIWNPKRIPVSPSTWTISNPRTPIIYREKLSPAAFTPDQVVWLKNMTEQKEEVPWPSSIKHCKRPPKASCSLIQQEEPRILKTNALGTNCRKEINPKPGTNSRLSSEVVSQLPEPEIYDDQSSSSISLMDYDKDDLISFCELNNRKG